MHLTVHLKEKIKTTTNLQSNKKKMGTEIGIAITLTHTNRKLQQFQKSSEQQLKTKDLNEKRKVSDGTLIVEKISGKHRLGNF
jgi:hypothetical protein